MAAVSAKGPSRAERIAAARTAVEALKTDCEDARAKLGGGHVAAAAKASGAVLAAIPRLSWRRLLKGHFGKVYALAWANDSRTLVTARCVLLCWGCVSMMHFCVPDGPAPKALLRCSSIQPCHGTVDVKMQQARASDSWTGCSGP